MRSSLTRAVAAGALTGGYLFTLVAQPAPAAFEVASIRQHLPPMRTMGNLTLSGPRVTLEGYNLNLLIIEAFDLRGRWQVSFAPASVKDELLDVFYDIVARAPGDGALTRAECRKMLQTLLTERFKLSSHREMKDTPVYAMTPGKAGPKFEESKDDGNCSVNVGVVTGGQSYSYSHCTMEALAAMLGQGLVDRPVLDRTELTGKYTFRFVAMPEFMNRNQADTAAVSPYTAIQDLGLKLQPQKVPMEVIVIDRFEKPTDN